MAAQSPDSGSIPGKPYSRAASGATRAESKPAGPVAWIAGDARRRARHFQDLAGGTAVAGWRAWLAAPAAANRHAHQANPASLVFRNRSRPPTALAP